MPELVINTGPIIALTAAMGDLGILDRSYERVLVPAEVHRELLAGGAQCAEIRALSRLRKVTLQPTPTVLPALLRAELDEGEASVIQCALDHAIPVVAIDEKLGRRLARLHGLRLTGSIGILVKASRSGFISDLSACFNRMRDKGVWISDPLIAKALEAARNT